MEHIEISSSGSLHILGTFPDIPVYIGIIDDHIVKIAEEEVDHICTIDRRALVVGDVILIRMLIEFGERQGFYEFLYGALKVFSHRDNFRELECGKIISHVEPRNSLGYPARMFYTLFDCINWPKPLSKEINLFYRHFREGCYKFKEECKECDLEDDDCECCGWERACSSCRICSECISDLNRSCIEDFWDQVMHLADSMYGVRQTVITLLLILKHCESALSGVPKDIFGVIGAMLTSEVSLLVK